MKNIVEIKNVIVGIDFSEGSLNAMQHAISIASRYNAKLVLLYVLTPDAKTLVGTDEVNKSNIVSYVEKKLKILVSDCKKSLPRSVVEHKIRMGKVSREMNTEADEQGNALIVVGTHGCSEFKEFFMGSSAFRIISASKSPVISVRSNISIQRDLTDILIVIDDSMETLQKLKYAVSLAKRFHAKVHIMGMYPTRYKDITQRIDAYIKHAEIYLLKNNVRLDSILIKKNKKVDTVLEYAAKKNVNLIIVMKEVELAGDMVFIMAPFSERIVNRSSIPVLTVNVDESIYPDQFHAKKKK
jgi:nucleotide-binding universal stress UspA family protein